MSGSGGASKGGEGKNRGGGSKQQKRPKVAPAPLAPPVDLPLPTGGIPIDGSMLEGGGQILRNASALAAILQRPLKVDKVRAGRSKPGLRPQHLTGLQLIAALCHGGLQGGQVDSQCITLQPGQLVCSHHVADTKTAGSCMLLAQSALPCLLYAAPAGQRGSAGSSSTRSREQHGAAAEAVAGPEAGIAAEAAVGQPSPPAEAADNSSVQALEAEVESGAASQLDLRGGTDASMAPPAGYMQHVLLPTLRRHLGIQAGMRLVRRGFFPKGQGQVLLTVHHLPLGTCLPAIDLTQRGDINSITIRAFTAEVKSSMGRCGVSRQVPVEVEVTQEPAGRAFGDGCGVLVAAESSTGCVFGASGLGERGVPAEAIGQRAACELMDVLASGACTDEWLQDQLVVFMALAQGRSRVLTGEPTLHTRTACMVAEALTPAKFSITKAQGGNQLWLVECSGAGVAAGAGS